ncbi:MAG: hypothetical protein ACOYO1_18875 [Bacteroidales bacterium]
MKMLVACEYSATIREAFKNKGWDSWSCDILDTDIPGQHYKGDIFEFLKIQNDFDLMIAHPPCTYLSFAGKRTWLKPGYVKHRIKAAEFFINLFEVDIKHICIENPSGIMTNIFRAADQEIHPYYFGEPELKRTQLWLKNLPPLIYNLSNDLFNQKTASEKPEPSLIYMSKQGKIKREYFTYCKNSHERSKTFQSIANAMADQWTEYFINLNN